MKSRFAFALAGVLATISVPVAAQGKIVPSYVTPDHVRQTATVQDDPLEFEATVSTEGAHRTGRSFFSGLGKDTYLVASVNKQTGATRYEIHQKVRYMGKRRTYVAAHLSDGAGLKLATLSMARHGEDICPSMDTDSNLECVFTKEMRFEVSEDQLRRLASSHASGQSWNFKFKEVGGKDVTGSLSHAEITGGLQAVQDYRSRLTQS